MKPYSIRRDGRQFVVDMLHKLVNAGIAWWYRQQRRYE